MLKNGGLSHARLQFAPMQFVLEYAPIILFFVAYKLKDIYFATGIAIGASIAAIAYAFFIQKKVSGIQWASLAIIIVFGGATLALHDEVYIKWKPSALYVVLATTLAVGKLFLKRDWIDVIFKQANIVAPARVWTALTWTWVSFFIGMAALNGYVATHYSLDTWVNFKVWWAMGIFFAFTVANVFYLSRYMKEETPTPANENPPAKESA
jgi:intracellular septation protein